MVVVCAAIRCVVGPLQVVLGALLREAGVAAQLELAGVRPGHTQVCLPGDLTGPSASYATVVRHPRFRVDSQVDWKDSDLQHHGRQTTDELNYIMEPRPERGLCIFVHDQPPPAASGSSGASPSSGRCNILRKQLLEDEPALQIVRHDVAIVRSLTGKDLWPTAPALGGRR